MTRPLLALLTMILLTMGGSAPAAAVTAEPPRSPAQVIVVGVPGLRWQDLSAEGTPALWALLQRGSAGALSLRSARSPSCAADGWLSLGAGNRAAGPAHGGCPQDLPVDAGTLPALAANNAELGFGTEIAALGDALRAEGICRTAIGPGAALALGGAGVGAGADQVLPNLAAGLGSCPMVVVDLPPIEGEGTQRSSSVRGLDDGVATLTTLRPSGSTLLLAGLAVTGDTPEGLQVAVADGPGYSAGVLSSGSTRRAPYVQVIDIAPTVLAGLGLPAPSSMAGEPWRAAGAGGSAEDRAGELADLDVLARAHHQVAPPFFVGLGALVVAVLGLALACPRHPRVRRLVPPLALAVAAAPLGTLLAGLVPWWRLPAPGVAVALLTTALAGLLALAALSGSWRHRPAGPAVAIAAVTTFVLLIDLVTGARLQIMTLSGYSPLVAGRFAGLGNVAAGVLAVAALLATAALASSASAGTGKLAREPSRHVALLLARGPSLLPTWLRVAAAGLLVVAVAGHPLAGADVGSVLALVPGFIVLGLLLTGQRISPGRLVTAVAGGALVVAVLAVLDAARAPGQRTHLGRFVIAVRDGEALTIVDRKLEANLDLLTTTPLHLVVPFAAAAVAVPLLRPPPGLQHVVAATPWLRPALLAALTSAALGFLVNDSGVAVLAVALTVGVPLAVAVALRTPIPTAPTETNRQQSAPVR